MTTSLHTIEELKQLTLELSNSPLGDYRKVATMFEAIGNVVAILNKQNKEQQKLLEEKENLEQICQLNEAKYKTIFNNSPDAIFVIHDSLYVDCNQKALEMFCCTKKDILNQDITKFSPRLQPNGITSRIGMQQHFVAATQGLYQSFYWRHLKKDNTPFDVWVRINRLDDIKNKTWLLSCLHHLIDRNKK